MQDTDVPAPKHVVLVGINYAPEQSGIAPYTTGLAERLVRTGHRVTVITGMPHYPEWRIAPTYSGKSSVEEHRNGVRVLRFGSYIPQRQSAVNRARYEGSFFRAATAGFATVDRADVVVGVVPTLSGAMLARALARRDRVPYGIIFQDMMGPSASQSGIPGGRSVAALTRALEGHVARGAEGIAIVAERFLGYLVSIGVDPNRVTHVPNWTHVAPPTADRESTRARFGWSKDDIVVLHAGNMGLKQGLDQVISAARRATRSRPRIRFVFVGDGNQRAHLQRSAAGLRNVEFHPLEPEQSFPDVLAAADVLLLSERPTATDMSLPSKLTSYFAAGRPLVAAVAPGGATATEIARCGGGLVTPAGDSPALLDAIQRVHSDSALGHRIAESAMRYAEQSLSERTGLRRAEAFVASLHAAFAEPTGARSPKWS